MSDKSRLPTVGEYVRNYGELVEVREVTPLPPATYFDYIFKSYAWRIDALANGRQLRTFSEYNDFYGRETGRQAAIDNAEKLVAEYGDAIEIIVVKVTAYRRLKPTGNDNIYDKTYCAFDSYAYSDNVPDPEEEVVWSSKQAKEGK